MNLKDITAVVLIKNESNFIAHVVSPLLERLGGVIVGDTGSKDGTPEILSAMGIEVHRFNPDSPMALGLCRNELQQLATTPWTMIVDGDELYPIELFDDIEKCDPQDKILGFTPMISVDFVGGQYVLMDDRFSRVALHPKDTIYHGEYPFEGPASFDDPRNFFYVQSAYTAYHLHRLNRSPLDEEVYIRKGKQYQYSLQDKVLPVLGPVALPLNPKHRDPYALK